MYWIDVQKQVDLLSIHQTGQELEIPSERVIHADGE
jgi:hypothetical protein